MAVSIFRVAAELGQASFLHHEVVWKGILARRGGRLSANVRAQGAFQALVVLMLTVGQAGRRVGGAVRWACGQLGISSHISNGLGGGGSPDAQVHCSCVMRDS